MDPEILLQIYIEGTNICDLNLKAYRAEIGCVQQEPVLFEGTISDNIRMGKLDATQQEIEEAAIEANAHDFISRLPEVGDCTVCVLSYLIYYVSRNLTITN